MLPLPIFDYHRPSTLRDAAELLHSLGPQARVIAGGTDVLPNMKQGLFDPAHVVSVTQIAELRGIDIRGDRLWVGAGMRLDEIADNLVVRRLARALSEACGAVGGPHHRAMGTLGGNICLDTRCRYYNQTYFWRKALGFCLKKDGTVCHVVNGGQKCVAAASNDSAPALIALDAEIHLFSSRGERSVAAASFYTADGIRNTTIEPDEIVVGVTLPTQEGRQSTFEKLRRRGAIDFPLLSIAVRVDAPARTNRANDASTVDGVRLVVSALGARPRVVRAAESIAKGTATEGLASTLSAAAFRECKPLSNVDEDTEWRREMVVPLTRRAIERVVNT